ncbi:TD and POZ domain-containing protein 5 [Caerostris extrusa]|uniref:TD and POZ domain-containing protein 5 n=1 Tax=Caerostris extrusa TaxID=172846 RepID=A0AAV4Y0V3_CAEEX|nr:TD and POZ domain-containing protein 5 [Caerostris extrusa]
MAGRGNEDRKCCTIIWIIDNFRYCWQELDGFMESPIFDFESLENTKWHLKLYPRGSEAENFIDLCLRRDEAGPELITVDIELVISSMNGTGYRKKYLISEDCEKDPYYNLYTIINRSKLLDSNKNRFLQKDSLLVQLRMWRTDGKELKGEQFIARTVVEIERRSFIWDIKYLTSNQIFEQTTLQIALPSKKAVFNLSPLLKEGSESVEEEFAVKITADDERIEYATFHCDLLDSLGNKLDCGEKEFWLDHLKEGAIFTLPYTHKKLIEERAKYLPKDVLSLRCDIVISTGDTTDRIESYITGIDDNICDQNFEKYESGISPDLKGDLKSMYREGTLSDTKIRTSTETFPAHTQILGARSPVFRAMFSTDMKERTKECVDITDFDGETVRRMLLYMYTDALEEDLQCQSVCQLYAAADKYAVLSLKNKCSSFLERIFSVTSACNILSLADLHQDEELKSSVREYILLNPEIFSSEEWQLLMKSNPRLALETMYVGYKGYYEE